MFEKITDLFYPKRLSDAYKTRPARYQKVLFECVRSECYSNISSFGLFAGGGIAGYFIPNFPIILSNMLIAMSLFLLFLAAYCVQAYKKGDLR